MGFVEVVLKKDFLRSAMHVEYEHYLVTSRLRMHVQPRNTVVRERH